MSADANTPDGRLRILVADDAFAGRELLARTLPQLVACEIHEARDGTDALRLYRELMPQIVFLDLDMPGMGGMSVLRDIRAEQPDAFAVVVSAHSSLEHVREAIALGVGGYVVKPFSLRRLHEVLLAYERQHGRLAWRKPP
jgi:two-component system chemotaxis response regulator CheY